MKVVSEVQQYKHPGDDVSIGDTDITCGQQLCLFASRRRTLGSR